MSVDCYTAQLLAPRPSVGAEGAGGTKANACYIAVSPDSKMTRLGIRNGRVLEP